MTSFDVLVIGAMLLQETDRTQQHMFRIHSHGDEVIAVAVLADREQLAHLAGVVIEQVDRDAGRLVITARFGLIRPRVTVVPRSWIMV